MNPKIVCFGFFFYFVSTSDKKGKNNLKYDFWIYKFNKINNNIILVILIVIYLE